MQWIEPILFLFSPSESDGNHSSDDEVCPMDEAPAKPEEAVSGAAPPIISLSAVHSDARGQLILNGSANLLAGSQSLLLNGNPLLSGASTGVIINGLSLGDGQTVTLSPAAAAPLIVNGAQVIAKSGVGLQREVAGGGAGSPSVIATSVPGKAVGSDAVVDFIPDSDSSASSSSSSSPSNAIPSLVLTSSSSSSSVSPATPTSAAAQVEYVVLAPADSQPNPPTSVISSCSSSPQVFSLPQVVPSIQGIPVSQLVPSGTPGSQCPQLVPVAPLTSSATHFQSQTLHTAGRLVQQQQQLTGLTENGTTTIVSISPISCSGGENQASIAAAGKIQVPQVISISSPTQVVPTPQAKGSTTGHLVSLSMPQLVPVSPIQTSSSVSFPQVVPAVPSLSIPSAGVPLQILTSGATQAPVKINQLRSLQSVAPTTTTAVAPGVQLLNSGIIQLPSSSPGTMQCLS